MQLAVIADLDRLVSDLLDEALARWCTSDWFRAGDDEGSCTVRIVNYMHEARHADDKYFCLTIEYEAHELTEAMLDGTVRPTRARRPDLRIGIDTVRRSLECKRLDDLSTLTREYVANGMGRFIAGAYGPEDPSGYMIGYAKAGASPPAIVDRINEHLVEYLAQPPESTLREIATRDAWSWYESHHNRRARDGILIKHIIVSLN